MVVRLKGKVRAELKPFGVTEHTEHSQEAIQARLKAGRTTGKCNLQSLELNEIPEGLYNQEPLPGVNFWDEVELTSLNLSHNRLSDVSNQLSRLDALTGLDIRHNCFQGCLPVLTNANLKAISLCHNKLSGIFSPSQASLPAVDLLQCSNNQLTELSLECVPNLLKLCASSNLLQKISALQTQAGNLMHLELSSNQIVDLQFLQGLGKLQHLALATNRIAEVSTGILSCSALRFLDLRQNQITSIPNQIAQLECLESLLLGSNRIESLPSGMSSLASLHTLELQENRLSSLDPSISRLQLTALNLMNNSLASLPAELGKMRSLKSMPVMGNPIRNLKPALFSGPLPRLLDALSLRLPKQALDNDECVQTEAVTKLEQTRMTTSGRIELSSRQLNDIPNWVWSHVHLMTSLDVSSNNLQTIDSHRLGMATSLRTLNIGRNQLSTWPLPSAWKSRLAAIDLSWNSNLHVPASAFTDCGKSLKSLNLSGVRGLDQGVLSSLNELTQLDLASCGLQEIAHDMLSLPHLQHLDLSNNQIYMVPLTINLFLGTFLDLTNNNISRLPAEMGTLPNCQTLHLHGNPLRSLPRTVLNKGGRAVIQYLKELRS